MTFAGLGDAVVQTGTQGYAGILGQVFPQAFQVGLGVSGIIASAIRILTKLSLPEDAEGAILHVCFLLTSQSPFC
jgi:hypothetical protein